MKLKLITYLFLLAIGLPILLSLLNVSFGENGSENRALQPRPRLTLNRAKKAPGLPGKMIGLYRDIMIYRDNFDVYYQDNFVLKPVLFDTYQELKRNVFHVNPIPQKVLEGTDGWMFIGDSYGQVILESKGLINFSENELQGMRNNMLERNQWLNEKGIEYYVGIAPNKHAIYGDHLGIKKSNLKTKFEQMKEVLASTELNLIDLADYYDEHSDQRLFYKTDTHWNDVGALLGYQRLMRAINKDFPDVNVLDLDDFDQELETTYQGDLTKMLNIERAEENIYLKNKNLQATLVSNQSENYWHKRTVDKKPIFNTVSPVNDLKVMVFRDSYGKAILPYLAETFGECVFIYSNVFNEELIKEVDPDIVIQEIVERNIDGFINESELLSDLE